VRGDFNPLKEMEMEMAKALGLRMHSYGVNGG
jgi:hypothetical protein